MNCVIYIRVSDQQQTRGSSLADQERTCRELAKRSGFKVLRVYRDEGRSAYKDELHHRPQFAAMLAAASGHTFKAQGPFLSLAQAMRILDQGDIPWSTSACSLGC